MEKVEVLVVEEQVSFQKWQKKPVEQSQKHARPGAPNDESVLSPSDQPV